MTWNSPTLSIQGRDDVVGVEPGSSDTWRGIRSQERSAMFRPSLALLTFFV